MLHKDLKKMMTAKPPKGGMMMKPKKPLIKKKPKKKGMVVKKGTRVRGETPAEEQLRKDAMKGKKKSK